MEFPFKGLIEINSSKVVVGQGGSLYDMDPVVAAPYIGVLSVAAAVGTVGNVIIIATVTAKHLLSQRQRTEATGNDVGLAFIVNLATSDLIVTAVINPLAIAGAVLGEEKLLTGRQWLCTTAASLCIISCMVSMFSIALIAVNRYLYVCWHDTYDAVFTRRRTVVAVVLTWLAGLFIDLPNHLGWSSHKFDAKTQKCLWDRSTAYHYSILFVCVGMLFPFVIVIISYWHIFAYIHLAKKRVLRRRFQVASESTYVATMQTIRQVKTVFVVFIAFACCWSPYVVVLLYDYSDTLPLPVHLYASMIAHLHASLNFVIYGLMNRNVCSGSATYLLGCSYCQRVTLSSSDSSDALHVARRESRCNGRVYVNKSLPAVEYHHLQEIGGCNCRNVQ